MIIGMNHGIVAQSAAKNLNGTIGDHFVAVHMEADAGPSLEDVNHKFLVPLALINLFRRLDDRVCEFFI